VRKAVRVQERKYPAGSHIVERRLGMERRRWIDIGAPSNLLQYRTADGSS